MHNHEVLSKLCQEFTFEAPTLIGGHLVSIKSKNDLWYLPNLKYHKGKTIRLLHANASGKSGYHYQKSFNTHREMFEYIAKHDNKSSFAYNKVFNVLDILKSLEAKRK
jgi:hypothetical protein